MTDIVYLDHPEPTIIQHEQVLDTVSEARGDSTFCGARHYNFFDNVTGLDASELIVSTNDVWYSQAASSSTTPGW